jgi:spore coat-associated protein N
MSRLTMLVHRPKRTLGALASVLLAVGLTAASGADFTAQSANPSNTFTAGSLSIENSNEGAAILTASNMRPGDPATTGTVDIKNTGSLTAPFTLAKGTLTDTDAVNPMSAKLNATVVDCGVWVGATAPTCGDGDDVTKYTGGTLAEMGTAGHLVSALGSYVANAKHRYKFSVALDSSAGDAYQNGSTTAQFVWTATS